MKLASARLIIDKNGSDVPKINLTPAEVQLLCVKHMAFCGKVPITNLKEEGEVQRSVAVEIKRLSQTYGEEIVQHLFGKVNHRLPETFKDAIVVPDSYSSPEVSEEELAGVDHEPVPAKPTAKPVEVKK